MDAKKLFCYSELGSLLQIGISQLLEQLKIRARTTAKHCNFQLFHVFLPNWQGQAKLTKLQKFKPLKLEFANFASLCCKNPLGRPCCLQSEAFIV